MSETRYRMLTAPAELGAARVAAAEDLRLGRIVELVTIAVPGADAAGLLGRLATLRHVALAPLVDVERAGRELRLVWPLAVGRPLAPGLGSAAALEALEPVADALDQAHDAGIVHGAIEPSVVEVHGRARLRRLGVLALAGTAGTRADDRAAFARLARHALVGDGPGTGRIHRLGPVVETAPAVRLPDAARHLLESSGRPVATSSCAALVASLRALL